MIPDPQLLTEILKLVVVKLSSTVRDDHPWNPEQTDEVFLDKVLYFGLCDYCQRFCFYPLHEIVNSDD